MSDCHKTVRTAAEEYPHTVPCSFCEVRPVKAVHIFPVQSLLLNQGFFPEMLLSLQKNPEKVPEQPSPVLLLLPALRPGNISPPEYLQHLFSYR